jgi:hypothetical protein
MSFDPEKVQRFVPRDWIDGKGGSAMRPALKGSYVFYDDYESLLSLLHEVSTDADPAGTVRELAVAKETIAAQEKLIEQLRKDLEFSIEMRVADTKSNRDNFLDWRKAHHDPLRYRVMDLESEVSKLKEERK